MTVHATWRIQWWRAATLAGLAVVSATNLWHLGASTRLPPTADAPAAMIDYVTRSERRFAAFRQAVHVRGIRGTIGYVEDLQGIDPDWPDFEPDYFIAQFVVLPLVLDSDLTRTQWALGNFRGNSLPPIPDGWRIVEDFGRGVLLLRKSGT